MTSRARRIVLAMYGHREFTPVVVTTAPSDVPPYYTAHCCYEAMDDVDDIMPRLTADGAWIIPPAPRILIGGNFGLPCA